MSAGVISRRYALALLNLAEKAKQLEAAARSLDDVAAALDASPSLPLVLTSPQVPHEQKQRVLEDVIKKVQALPLAGQFLRFLLHKRRIGILVDIRGVFNQLADERLGRAHADVIVAVAVNKEQEAKLLKLCEKISGKKITMGVRVDPGILGGAVARIGSRVWDGSAQNALRAMRSAITQG